MSLASKGINNDNISNLSLKTSPSDGSQLIDDKTISSMHFIRAKPFLLRYDTTPFFILYGIFYGIYASSENEWWTLFGLIGLPVILGLHIIVGLIGYWNIPLRMKIAYYPVHVDEICAFLSSDSSKQHQLFKIGCDIVIDRYQRDLAWYTQYKTIHDKKVEVYTKAYEKQLSTWNENSGQPKPKLVLPDPPSLPTLTSPPLVLDGSIIEVAIIPLPAYGAPYVCEVNYNNGQIDRCFGNINTTTHTCTLEHTDKPLPSLYVDYLYTKLYFNNHTKVFLQSHYPEHDTLATYYNSPPLTEKQAQVSRSNFGKNTLTVPIPSFLSLLIENAMAPFFVFQIFCVLLWMLDEYWYYSLFTLAMLVLMECMVVYRRRSHLSEMLGPKPPLPRVYVCRDNTWSLQPTHNIVPGDIILIEGQNTLLDRTDETAEIVAKSCCDALLLDGSVIADEAILTGESVPQMKDSIDTLGVGIEENIPYHVYTSIENFIEPVPGAASNAALSPREPLSPPSITSEQPLDCNTMKKYMVYSGTEITGIKRSYSGKLSAHIPEPPVEGAIGIVVKTGFGTMQGNLVRTILTSSGSMPIDIEALMFIGLLLIVAIIASYYVLMAGLEDPKRSRYKLLLNIMMILTSVVPPDLPVQLSLAVNNTLLALSKLRIFCTEPARIPYAGSIDVVCFDKTGTLTDDKFIIHSVIDEDLQINEIQKYDNISNHADNNLLHVLSTCHEISVLPTKKNSSNNNNNNNAGSNQESVKYIGDPLEIISFESIPNVQYTNMKSYDMISSEMSRVLIHQRFSFESSKQRMSCVIALHKGLIHPAPKSPKDMFYDSCMAVVTKGAPEMIYSLLDPNTRPEYKKYITTCNTLAKRGLRVLAYAWKPLYCTKTSTGLNFYDPNAKRGILPKEYEQYQSSIKYHQADVECNLQLSGIIAFSSPLKKDSQAVVTELQESGHYVTMITGDHNLTAISVSQQLGITKLPVKTLLYTNNTLQWYNSVTDTQEVCNSTEIFDTCKKLVKEGKIVLGKSDKIHPIFDPKYDYCMTGPALNKLMFDVAEYLHNSVEELQYLGYIFLQVCIFARTSPKDKEYIIRCLKEIDCDTLMCGDGTNDVGALRKANIGIALLSKEGDSVEDKVEKDLFNQQIAEQDKQAIIQRQEDELMQRVAATNMSVRLMLNQLSKLKQQNKTTQYNLMRKQVLMMCETDAEDVTLRPGDASMAAPFTAKHASPKAVVEILRLGRTALVSTMQMYQILAVNCLILAYGMSVLFIKGVKSGEAQMTVQNLASTACFLMLSRATPLDRLHKQRPYAKILSTWMFSTVIGQCLIHYFALTYAQDMATPYIDDTTISGLALLQDDVYTTAAANNTSTSTSTSTPAIVSAVPSKPSKPVKKPVVASSSTLQPASGTSTTTSTRKALTLEDLKAQLAKGVPSVNLDEDADSTSSTTGTDSTTSTSTSTEEEAPANGFVPNVLNTSVWLVQTVMMAATFLANYRGYPFSIPLSEHSNMYKTLLFTVIGCVLLSLEFLPDINEALGLVSLPSTEYSLTLCAVIILDVVLSTGIGQVLMKVFALGPKLPPRHEEENSKPKMD